MANPHATKLHTDLVHEWAKGLAADQKRLTSLLSLLKIELSQLGLLFPSVEDSPDAGALIAARDILEIGAYHSIRSQDVPAFERYLNLLGNYYNDFGSVLAKSANEAPLVALSLLRLLSLNNIAGFHTLLETLPSAITDSSEVTWVTHLEQCLMEGSYSRVWQLCRPAPASAAKLPRPEFAFFVATLVGTVRNEIAACDEKAYTTLPLADARTLLFFESEADVRAFAATRNWFIDPKAVVHFPASPNHPNKTAAGTTGVPAGLATGGFLGQTEGDKELDKIKVVAAALSYAKELESIV